MLKFSRRPLSRNQIQLRAFKLSLVSSPILGAFFFNHTDYSSPFFCPLRTFTGIPCPGCGMTRSFLAIARGDFSGAIAYNLFGPILFAGCFVFALHLTAELFAKRSLHSPQLQFLLHSKKVRFLALSALFCYYAIRIDGLARSGELSIDFARSPLGQFLLSS
ncbi:DUF2752 domain-containing protein [Lusitaniella coriacea LEGE 07157]|uniref:DUF2752 domain-containing protein n=1 Tax=Lusitaniella coriacea LEGE 07157 TaxID=945747 RepID=A0A8J7E161_9CYAN|nr:DUF2752 domain-containing protein [Lusitaniella coriacea]MBE9118606.1 DUF2752 domain-containing protein [Lusitaniella coriacea LEGE 07157]